MKKHCCLFLIQSLMVIACFAQQEEEIKKKLESLSYFTGSWKVNVHARLSAQGPWDTSMSNSVIRLTTGSKLIEEDFTGTRQGKPFLVKMILAVNNLTGVYQRIFADSEHGGLVDFEGTKTADGFVFDKLFTYTNGSTVKLRVAYTIISKDEFKVENMRMPQGSTSWDVSGRMQYRRVK